MITILSYLLIYVFNPPNLIIISLDTRLFHILSNLIQYFVHMRESNDIGTLE